MVEGAGAEVDEAQSAGLHLHQYVLILDVAVNYARLVHRDQDVDNLPEEIPRLALRQGTTFGDVVEQISAMIRSL